jgi:hypothetical protein
MVYCHAHLRRDFWGGEEEALVMKRACGELGEEMMRSRQGELWIKKENRL